MIDVVFHLIVLWKTHEIALLHGGKILHGCRSYAHHVCFFLFLLFSVWFLVESNATPAHHKQKIKYKNNQFTITIYSQHTTQQQQRQEGRREEEKEKRKHVLFLVRG